MPIVNVNNSNCDSIALRNPFLGTYDGIGLSLDFDRSKAIFIKPNVTYPYFKEGVTIRQILLQLSLLHYKI
jgi:hypothetical protein